MSPFGNLFSFPGMSEVLTWKLYPKERCGVTATRMLP